MQIYQTGIFNVIKCPFLFQTEKIIKKSLIYGKIIMIISIIHTNFFKESKSKSIYVY